jgi:glycerol-3-phosphate acyltransferase PlsX
MGGDRAPEATVAGAVLAARSWSLPVLLVGDRERLQQELAKHRLHARGIEVVHAEESIGMEEAPGQALLRKRGSSILVAANLVREGRASGLVSAGNSGAVTGAALVRLGMLPGVEKPAIAVLFPSREGRVVVLDAGATVDARPEHLVDFAHMGARYARCLLKVTEPRVGLLSIGEEPSKGNALIKQAHLLLASSDLRFVGNLEGKDIAQGRADVVVCDGFAGNVLLKGVEGYAELFRSMLSEGLRSGWRGRIGGWLAKPTLRAVARQMDYASCGGALLLGVNGVVVIGHGRSSPEAISNALRVAGELAEQGVVEKLAASFRAAASSPSGAV